MPAEASARLHPATIACPLLCAVIHAHTHTHTHTVSLLLLLLFASLIMQVNSLLERMRKLRQEKAAATAAAAAAGISSALPASTAPPNGSAPAARDGAEGAVAARSGAESGGAASEGSAADAAAPPHAGTAAVNAASATTTAGAAGASTAAGVPAPPPVFASPLSARPDYRDAAADALCIPFTGDMSVRVLQQLLLLADPPADASSGETAPRASPVLDMTVSRLREALAARGAASDVTPKLAPGAALFDDAAYVSACAAARVDVSGAVRPICRDVNTYTRVARISQGVYGVVFRAVKTSDWERQQRREARRRAKQQATPSSPPLPVASSHAVSLTNLRSFALKHIKKMWLEDSEVGMPPYLMREIDLLLRLQHPNIMGALELVLLDPLPLPRPAITAASADASDDSPSTDSTVSSPSSSSSSSSGALSATASPAVGTDGDGAKGPHAQAPSAPTASRRRDRHHRGRESSLEGKVHGDEASGSAAAKKPKVEEAAAATATATAPAAAAAAAAARPLAAVGATSQTKDMFIVMDYCPYDLGSYMRRYANVAADGQLLQSSTSSDRERHAPHHGHRAPVVQVPYFHVTPRNVHPLAAASFVARAKSIVYQMLRAVAFLHENRILHRDLKTSNVLLGEDGRVKVCDFGLGRLYREGQALTPTVVTLMYRAPELHFGVVDYSHKMDVWSVGCIFAELFLRRPLFHASSDSQHLLAVCDVLGIPTEETFPGLYHLPQTKTMMRSLPRWNRVSRLAALFQQRGATLPTVTHGDVPVAAECALLPASGVELLAAILQWNPRRRPSAAEALQHPFFREDPLPCAPAELMRPMPWQDAAAAALHAGGSDRREGAQPPVPSATRSTMMATATTHVTASRVTSTEKAISHAQGGPSPSTATASLSVPPALRHVVDLRPDASAAQTTAASTTVTTQVVAAVAVPAASAGDEASSPAQLSGGHHATLDGVPCEGREEVVLAGAAAAAVVDEGEAGDAEDDQSQVQLRTRMSTRDQDEEDGSGI